MAARARAVELRSTGDRRPRHDRPVHPHRFGRSCGRCDAAHRGRPSRSAPHASDVPLESGHSSGRISLSGLLAGEASRSPDPGLDVRELAKLITVGGWPGPLDRPVEDAIVAVRAYLDDVRRADIQRVDGVAHDPERVMQLMRSLARNVSTMVGIATRRCGCRFLAPLR